MRVPLIFLIKSTLLYAISSRSNARTMTPEATIEMANKYYNTFMEVMSTQEDKVSTIDFKPGDKVPVTCDHLLKVIPHAEQ